MPTSLTLEQHLMAIAASGRRLGVLARSAGEEAKVPTCPAWNVQALLAHQTMVHRWATAHLTGSDPSAVASQTEIRRSVDNLDEFYHEGLERLLRAVEDAPEDLKATTFLNDAPPARRFWARRQAHETTVHMVDALSADVGRWPTVDEANIDHELAFDGIDELLAGFFTRGRSKLYDGDVFTIAVQPDEGDRQWIVEVAEQLTVVAEPAVDPALTISGSAAAIYLGLWNRSDDLVLAGDLTLVDRWRQTQKVRWG